MATIVRKERTYGTIGRRSNAAKDESLEDFLKDFSASVAQAAVVTVKEGKGAYHAEIPAAGTELEKQLKVKAKKAGGPAPKEDAFVKPQFDPTLLKTEKWPELDSPVYEQAEREVKAIEEQEAKDNASVFSRTASSIRTAMTRTKKNGVSDLPAGLLIAEAKTTRERIGRDALNPSALRKALDTVTKSRDSPIAIMLNNNKMGGAPLLPVDDSAIEKAPEKEIIDARDAAFVAAAEAQLAKQREEGTVKN